MTAWLVATILLLPPWRSPSRSRCAREPTAGSKWEAVAPIFYDHSPGTPTVDPVVQALVPTDIVVGATISALLLALTLRIHKRKGAINPATLKPLRR